MLNFDFLETFLRNILHMTFQYFLCFRNIFLEKRHPKCGGETSSRHFFKNSKLSISLDQQPEILHSLLCYMSRWKTTKIYLNQGSDHFRSLRVKLF